MKDMGAKVFLEICAVGSLPILKPHSTSPWRSPRSLALPSTGLLIVVQIWEVEDEGWR